MTASSLSFSRLADDESPLRHLRPAEGWITVIAVAALPFAVAWSLDDAAWLLQSSGSTGYLMYLAIAATLVGVLLAKLGLGRFGTYVVGSIVGGVVVPFVAGNVVLGDADPLRLDITSILERYRSMASVVQQVWIDLVVNGQPFTTQSGHYHLVFGAIVWAAGLLAATAVIGRRRPIDAVVVTGLLLLTNEALTAHEQIQILVFFTIAALILLIRSHVFEEQVTWLRRRIGDPASVSALYLQSGAGFVAAAVLGALVLTGAASSAPLQGAWADLPQRLADVSRWVEKFAPPGGDPRPAGIVGFPSSVTTNGLWAPDQTKVAFVAQLSPGDTRVYRWRAGTYSTYTNFGWNWGPTQTIPQPAGQPLFAGSGDDPTLGIAKTEIKFTIEPRAFIDATAVSPASIDSVNRGASLVGVGVRLRFTTVTLSGGIGPYTVDALVPDIGDPGGITENRLRAAGRVYPTDISSIYLQLPDNAVGPAAAALLQTVEDQLGGKTAAEARPYDLAHALEQYLSNPDNFQYQADVRAERDQQCSGISSVECFARIHRGYCEYYASTMAVLLREARIPARIAYGFLPGERAADGTETVMASGQHWWVEVYFPGVGWVEFDPTGAVGRQSPLPSGAPVTPPPSGASFAPRDDVPVPHASVGPGGGGTTGTPSSGAGPFGVIALLLALAVVAVVVATRRRTRVGPSVHPDAAWGGLGRLAARFGFGPRPEQTVFEYAGALGEVVPAARVEVGTVAHAKVEVAYGRRELGEERLRSVGEAYRRLRLAVLRAGIARRLGRRRR